MTTTLQMDKKPCSQSGSDPNCEAVQQWLQICNSTAFTLIELLVVIAIIGLLASLLFPVLSRAKTKAQGIGCVNNLKQFALAWSMYTSDNNERIPPNNPLDHPESNPISNTWVRGWIQLGDNRPDDCNTVFLTQSLLGSYLGRSIQVWRCPSDNSVSIQRGEQLPRVRTVSMNCWLNCDVDQNWDQHDHFPATGRIIKRPADMISPGPSDTFVFTDERADSINDGFFAIPMYPQGSSEQLDDWPGCYHDGAGAFSFADGGALLHKWLDPRTTPPLSSTAIMYNNLMPNDLDIAWLQAHATSRR
jgi:prepilin-type N-terminal cleavage/methylation domain-containing protein